MFANILKRLYSRPTTQPEVDEVTERAAVIEALDSLFIEAEAAAVTDGEAVLMPDVNGVIFFYCFVTEAGFRYQFADMNSATRWLDYPAAYAVLVECAIGLR